MTMDNKELIDRDNISTEDTENIDLTNSFGLKNNYAERIYNYALYYISKGMYVIPCKKNDKAIIFRGRGSYDRASRDEKRIKEWFHPKVGEFAGCNIAIATGGDSAFIVDIDTINHEGFSGHETWSDLMHTNGEEGTKNAPMVKTPSGGEHLYFRWTEECGGSKDNLLGPGVDVKGGGPHSRRGHIMAPPSRINGREYKWVKSGDILDIPQWIINVRNVNGSNNLLAPENSNNVVSIEGKEINSGSGKGQEMDNSDLGLIENDQLNDMLKHLKGVELMGYGEWLEIGMAIHDASGGSDNGLEVWDSWSRSDDRYEEGICASKWKGFGDGSASGSKITANTLFYRAGVQGNWRPNNKSNINVQAGRNDVYGAINSEVMMMMEEMNDRFGFIVIGGRSRIIHKKRGKNQAPLMLINSFYDLTMNEWVEAGEKAKNVSKVWMTHRGRNSYEDIGMFVDDEDRHRVCDLWTGFDTIANYSECGEKDVAPILGFILEVICSGNVGYFEWIVDWIANIFQDPGEKRGRMGTCLVTRGKKGIGKGMLFNLINKMIGYGHATHITDHKLLVSEFNGWAIGKLFIFVDEAVWGGDKQGEGALKGLITEGNISYQFKGVDQQIGHNFCRVGFASNEDWVVPATKDERRFMMMDVSDKYQGNTKYWDTLSDWLYKEGGAEKFLGYLMKRKIRSNLRNAPKTKALADQVRLKIGSEIGFIIHLIEESYIENHIINEPNTIASNTLYSMYREFHKEYGYGNPKTPSLFHKVLNDHNFHNIMGKRRMGTKKRFYAYSFGSLHKCAEWINEQGIADLDLEYLEEDWINDSEI